MNQDDIESMLETAVQHHQEGRLEEAEEIYRQIVAHRPDDADVLQLLGVLSGQSGRTEMAIEWIRRAIQVNPDVAEYHYNIGVYLNEKSRHEEAIAAYRQAVRLQPDYPEAWVNLGLALSENQQLDQAVEACQTALKLRPDYPAAQSNLSNTFRKMGRFADAIEAARRAIALKPDYSQAYLNLGNAFKDNGQLNEAEQATRDALRQRADYPEAYNNLGNILREKGEIDAALDAYRQAIRLRPTHAQAYANFGYALWNKGRLDAAAQACEQALRLNPNMPEALANLGNILKDMGRIDEALASYAKALTLRPDDPVIHGNRVFTLHYHPDSEPAEIFRQHVEWARQHAQPLEREIRPPGNDRAPNRRLRIGYVSPDFRSHPVANFLLPLLENHNHADFEIFAYAQVPTPDATTKRLRALVDVWRDTVALPDQRLAELVRQDRIDILIDLAGHTSSSRLLTFARKPAPVQITWLGYPNTTGMSAMDYRLTDAHADPPGDADKLCTEELIRLPLSAWCFAPTETNAERQPAAPNSPITFASFNNLAKVTEPMLRLWGRILLATPGSRLLLKAKGLDSVSAQQRIGQIIHADGIDPSRIELSGWRGSYAEHLALYNRVDIALDTFPYHGTTTTCEAVWMGVPVITLAGPVHVSRVGVSLLSTLGLSENIARTPDEYVQRAVNLAGDRARLNDLHAKLRQRLRQSPLMDAPRFARDIEAVYRRVWQRWCEKPAEKR